MRLELLSNFIAVVECGTITAAARKIRIAQPALSSQLRLLEEEYGVPLLRRSTRTLELTEAGQVLYRRAKSICRLEAEVRQELRSGAPSGAGALRMGVSLSLPQEAADQLLDLFCQRTPAVVQLHSGSSAEIGEMLRRELVDVGMVRLTGAPPTGTRELFSMPERPCILSPADNLWLTADHEGIMPAELRDVPLCVDRENCDALMLLCAEAGFTPNLRCVADTQEQLRLWPARGLAAAVVLRSAHDHPERQFCCRPLLGPLPPSRRALLAGQRAEPPEAVHLLLECARSLFPAGA